MRSIKELQAREIKPEDVHMTYMGFRLDGTETEEEIDLIDSFSAKVDEPDEDDLYYEE